MSSNNRYLVTQKFKIVKTFRSRLHPLGIFKFLNGFFFLRQEILCNIMCVPFSRKKNCYPKNFNTKTKHNRDIDIIVKRYLKKFLHVCLDILFIFSSKFVHYYPSGIFNQSVSGGVCGHSPHNLIETYHHILMTILYTVSKAHNVTK